MTTQFVDPADLNAQEKGALTIIRNNPRLKRVRNGYSQLNCRVTLKMADRLEGMGLVRQIMGKSTRTVTLTGAGLHTLAVMDERRARRAAGKGEGRAEA